MSSTIKIQSHLSMKTFAPQLTVTSEAMMTKTYKIEFDDKITNAFNFENFLMEKGSALDEPVNDYDDETDLSSEDENENNNESIYNDFPPAPDYVENNDNNLNYNNQKKQPTTLISNNGGFDIKESIEKLKAQLNESGE